VPDVGHSTTVLCVAGCGFNYTARKDGNDMRREESTDQENALSHRQAMQRGVRRAPEGSSQRKQGLPVSLRLYIPH